jgi:hypothetical protein
MREKSRCGTNSLRKLAAGRCRFRSGIEQTLGTATVTERSRPRTRRYYKSVKVLKITWIPVLLALLYSGWVIWHRNQSIERPKPLAGSDPYGSVLKIQAFNAESGVLARGEKTLLCYGVVYATSVKIDPPVGDVWPSLSRCIEIAPTKTTHYVLTAGDGKNTVSKAVDVVVQ